MQPRGAGLVASELRRYQLRGNARKTQKSEAEEKKAKTKKKSRFPCKQEGRGSAQTHT